MCVYGLCMNMHIAIMIYYIIIIFGDKVILTLSKSKDSKIFCFL